MASFCIVLMKSYIFMHGKGICALSRSERWHLKKNALLLLSTLFSPLTYCWNCNRQQCKSPMHSLTVSPMHSLSHRHNRTCIYHGTISDSGREAGSKLERKQSFLVFVFFVSLFIFSMPCHNGRGENFACITLFQFFPCMIEGMFGFGLERECLREAKQYIGRIMWYLCYACDVQ